jgi:putative ABC transport system permease protein
MNFVALRMLMHDRAKYLGLVLGIAFATLLVGQQGSIFWHVLLQSVSTVRDIPEPDVWVTRPQVEHLDATDPMRETDLYRIRGVAGVGWALPLYQSSATLRGPTQPSAPAGLFRQVSVIGVDDATLIGAPTVVTYGSAQALREPDAVLLDEAAYRRFWSDEPLGVGKVVEIGRRRVRIAGICRSSPQFSGLPVVFARRSLAADMAREQESAVSFVIVRALEGHTPAEVAARITRETGLKALDRDAIAGQTIEYHLRNSGIAENFGVTIALGFVVGLVIVGQTFYVFAVENLKQFAALKAIGLGNRRIVGMLLLQASTVAAIGLGLGLGVASLFFYMADDPASALRGMNVPLPILVGTAGAVYLMVLLAALISARRVLTVEPAIVFKG